jgi:predicted 2-oxoglutarate/Fe(II)-dependent dioxygenase YbiX
MANATASAGAVFAIGDVLPPIVLADASGAKVDLSDQRLAGNTMLLWMAGADPDPDLAARLLGAQERFAEAGAVIYAVTTGSDVAGLTVLHEPEGYITKSVGITGTCMILLDPERRLVAVLTEDDGLETALAECAFIHDRTAETTARAQAPVIVIPRVLSPSLCRRLIAFWEHGEKLTDGVSSGSGGAHAAAREIKRRADVPVVDQALFDEISAGISKRVAPAILKAFQRQVTRCETLRIGCYDSVEDGAFGRHRDNATPYTAHRLFAMSLNLNDEYTGGEVIFPEYARTLYRPDIGDAVVFSCSMLHEALPVRSGRRFGLFTFMYDEAGAEMEQKMMERERAAGRDPFVQYKY